MTLVAEHVGSELADILDVAQAATEISDGFTVARAAEILSRDTAIDIGRSRLFTHLNTIGWTIRDHAHEDRWIATTTARAAGWLFDRDVVVRLGDIDRHVVPQILITLAGLVELRRTLSSPPDHPYQPPLFD